MGLHHLDAIAARLIAHGRPADCPVAVIENGTSARQRTVVAPLARIADEVAAARFEAPALIVVGEVVRLRKQLTWFAELALDSCGPAASLSTVVVPGKTRETPGPIAPPSAP